MSLNREYERMLFEAINFLERENAALRVELESQWWTNHAEHCDNTRECGPDEPCNWARPVLIAKKERA